MKRAVPEPKPRLAGEPPADRSVADVLLERGTSPDVIAAMTVVAAIQRVALRARNHLEQGVLKDSDLSWSGFMVLHTLWLYGELQTRYIAAELGVIGNTLSGILTTLERRGLLTRRQHAVDGRLVLVSLTEAGRCLVDSVAPAFRAEQVFLVSHRRLGSHRLRGLVDALGAIEHRLAETEEADRA